MCKRNLSLLAMLLAASLLLTACGGKSGTESSSGSSDLSASTDPTDPTGSTASTGSSAPDASDPFAPTVSTGSAGGIDPVPSGEADPAQVRACFDDLLAGKLGSGEQAWIDESHVSTVRSAVLALDGPVLTADDVDALARCATLFLADETRKPFVLPAFRPLDTLKCGYGTDGETTDADYRALLFYTLYLFTPSDRFFRAAEIWTDLPSVFGEDRSFTLYCLALADAETGSSPVEELYNGAPFVEVALNGETGTGGVNASQCTVVRAVRRGQTPTQLDAYSLFDDPTVRFSSLSWEEQMEVLRAVAGRCLNWMYAGEEVEDNFGRNYYFGTDRKAVLYLYDLPVPVFPLEQYETIVHTLFALGEGYDFVVCENLGVTPDAFIFLPKNLAQGYYLSYCLPGDYRTPEDARALIASGDVAYVRDLEDYSYPVLLVQGDQTTELFPAEDVE